MTKYILSIGLNDKESKVQEISDENALLTISTVCYEMVGGATIIPGCIGVYTHDDGTKVIEKTIRCEFYGADAETVKSVARVLCKKLNQETIAFEQVEIASEFIAG